MNRESRVVEACTGLDPRWQIDFSSVDQANAARAAWAAEALLVFAARTGVSGELLEVAVQVLVTDLFHLLALGSTDGAGLVEEVAAAALKGFRRELLEY